MKSSIQSFSLLSDFDIHLFKSGKHYKLHNKLGSHLLEHDGNQGVAFGVWAPNATAVSVVGDFNEWDREVHPLFPRMDGSGIWEGFIPNIGAGLLYKYSITSHTGLTFEKGDPFSQFWEIPPNTSSIVWKTQYKWKDKKWLSLRKKKTGKAQPYSVYEVHLGSWRKKSAHESFSYRELADILVSYVLEMGFSHVEFMPVMEHPYYPSWGYQITGFFAPTSRYGSPGDFKYLVDAFHQAGIGVLLDWVPSHFPLDGHGLAQFDGSHLFEHEDPRQGFHPDWKSAIFNLGRFEVRSFLISNAIYWLEEFHIDGLRVDAVASMLYLDYSREEGEWIPNKYGGNESLEAISFLREFNEVVYDLFPDIVTIAEESTSFEGVSRPTFDGGLGFGQKWMMGWMHDTLNYFGQDPINRKYHHNQITFSIIYAFSENFMLPLSHDEVVHGKGPLILKMPGDEWQRFANLRLLYGYMYSHPGSKILFMGGEFAQTNEWSIETGLQWELIELKFHSGMQNWIKQLNQLYNGSTALYEQQFDSNGFEWIDLSDGNHSIIIYKRQGKKKNDNLYFVCNFTPISHEAYQISINSAGTFELIINSDQEIFGGSDFPIKKSYKAIKQNGNPKNYTLQIAIPPLSIIGFKKKKPIRKKSK